MKKIGFLILFLMFTSSAFGQQYLWSTIKGDSLAEKYVPLNNVTEEVLLFCDQYDRYYDFSGFSKEGFIKFFKTRDFGFEDWKGIYDIKDLEVHALRANLGGGSVVVVVCISKKNVNMLIFTNHPIYELEAHYNLTFDKRKFLAWFKTLLN